MTRSRTAFVAASAVLSVALAIAAARHATRDEPTRQAFRSEARRLASPDALKLAMPRVALGGPDSLLSGRFPDQAARVVSGEGFQQSAGAFLPRVAEGLDPVRAAQASLTSRGGLRISLPAHGDGAIALSLPGGFSIEVRERGARGATRTVLGAIAFERDGGTSYWNATAAGYEEWLHVDSAGPEPVAEWEVRGATLRKDGAQVTVLDAAGTARLRVVAPAAYAEGGRPAKAWLEVRGDVLALHTDVRGPALVDPIWTTVGSMASARMFHTTTLLSSGKVLVAGGFDAGSLSSAELYDPATGSWTAAAPMAIARYGHTATLLDSGKVLVVGGFDYATGFVAAAETYEPETGSWSGAGEMDTARYSHTATLLASGKVLVVGGQNDTIGYLASAELYDPDPSYGSTTWSPAGQLPAGRALHTATRLPSGKVVVLGGYNGSYLSAAETYDPEAETWASGGGIEWSRRGHTATLLPSGRVLVTGGERATGPVTTSVLYDPGRGLSVSGSMATPRTNHTATLLPSGKVLVAGGLTGSTATNSAEVYDPDSGQWTTAVPMATAREFHSATLLPSGRLLLVGGSGDGIHPTAATEEFDGSEPRWTELMKPQQMTTARSGPSMTLLRSGKVLVVGGYNGGALASAELYDPVTGNWIAIAPMSVGRHWHTATTLQSGDVLVTGGLTGFPGTLTPTAELYHLATERWSLVQPMAYARWAHSATMLPSGKVLVVGHHATTEIYDPATGAWAITGTPAIRRSNHTATLLPSGKVLLAGGLDLDAPASASGYLRSVAASELYDPATGGWSPTGALSFARSHHNASLLRNGQVLVTGGSDDGTSLSSAELYEPAAGTWTVTGSMFAARYSHTATLLSSGLVLVAGGEDDTDYLSSVELFDPSAGAWTLAASMPGARTYHEAVLLQSGTVLVAGGLLGNALASADLYDPDTDSWDPGGPTRHAHTATLLTSGKVLVAGGWAPDGSARSSVETYDPTTGVWVATGSMIARRYYHAATLLTSGKVLVTGGYGGAAALSTTEVYDPATDTWTPSAAMSGTRSSHTATLLPSGKVLVVGGGGTAGTGSAELYDPVANQWVVTGSLVSGRTRHSATLLQSGKVLVAGGGGASAELYDPRTNAWTGTGSMSITRSGHTATLLPSGNVLVTGGIESGVGFASAELYDPATEIWSPTSSMSVPRSLHAATLLSSGKVLVAGGQGNGGAASAETYDPATGTWMSAGSMSTRRYLAGATLLPSGKVLLTCGRNDSAYLSSAELYDEGRAVDPSGSRTPTLDGPLPVTSSCGTLALTGTLFTGDSEASGGGTQSSPSNAPVVELSRQDNEAVAHAEMLGFTSTSIGVALPGMAAGPWWARVVVNGIPSAAQPLTIVPATILTGVSPTSGSSLGGTIVQIDLRACQAGATVTFGGATASCAISYPPPTIGGLATCRCITPAHAAGAVDVVATSSCGDTTLPGAFTYTAPTPPPTISSVSPGSGPTAGGNTVTLTGTGFQTGARVSVNGNPGTNVGVASATTLSFAAPPGAPGPATVVVTNLDGQQGSAVNAYRYVLPPTIASISPTSGPSSGGTSMTIRGSDFQAPASVHFGLNAAVSATIVDATTIQAVTPTGDAGPVNVTVTNGDGQWATAAGAFTYVPPPGVVSVSPPSGSIQGGTAIVISGSGFAPGASVALGGAPVTNVLVSSANVITGTTTAHAAGVVAVSVTNADGQSGQLPSAFTYLGPAPSARALTPTAGTTLGGTLVTVSGKNFTAGATITIGGLSATVAGATSTSVRFTTPAHAPGVVDVAVRNPDGQTATLVGAYTYVAPPPAPTGLVVTPHKRDITLTWNAVQGATGYVVLRGTQAGGPYAKIAAASPSRPSYVDRNVVRGTTYHYVVRASNAGGTSADSAPASATVQ